MRIVKPAQLFFVHRVFVHRGVSLMAVNVGYCIPFDAPSALRSESETWKMASTELRRSSALDQWMPKAQGEIIAFGSCFPEHPTHLDHVRLGLVSEGRTLIDKRLDVHGDRRATSRGASEPAFFERMPIDQTRAYGGKGFLANPTGKGFALLKDEETGMFWRPLPNLEDAKSPLGWFPSELERNEKIAPASLTGRDPGRAGPGGKSTSKAASSANAIDLAPYNVAPVDQRVRGYFEGTETIQIEHMHPDKPTQELTLPGFVARSFVRFTESHPGGPRFVEVPLSLDTIFLFPHRERSIVLFRGLCPVGTGNSDIELLVAALDPSVYQKRPLSYFAGLVQGPGDPARPFQRPSDDALLPSGSTSPAESRGAGSELAREAHLVEGLEQRIENEHLRLREALLESGVDPESIPDFAPPAVPIEDGARTDDAGRDQRSSELAKELGLRLRSSLSPAEPGASGLPRFSAVEELRRLRQSLRWSENNGVEIAGLRDRLADPNLFLSLLETERDLLLAYRSSAHLRPPADPTGPRADVRALLAGPGKKDLTGADLSGQDLSGLSLEGVFLESADLSGANLEGADLSNAVLAHAKLIGTNFTGANLTGANLGRANAAKALFGDAVMKNAIFAYANLSGASLDGADLTGARFDRADCDGARFERVFGEKLIFYRTSLKAASFRGASLESSSFAHCTATDLDACSAELSRSLFYHSEMERSLFKSSTLASLRIVQSNLAGADFSRAILPGADLRGVNLAGARFSNANLRRSDLSRANLAGADLDSAIATECLAIDVDLSRATLTGINLTLSIMHRAVLLGADVSRANLYCADLTGASMDERTSFSGANTERAQGAGMNHG